MYTIGEFSRITGMTVKALRFYHEQGLLTPSLIDEQTGYRYYDDAKVGAARVIAFLREMEFSVAEIRDILHAAGAGGDEGQLFEAMERQKALLEERIRRSKKAVRLLDQFLSEERQAKVAMSTSTFDMEERVLPPLLVAGVRMRGRYGDCGQGFARIVRAFGRFICGAPFLLHYDDEYRDEDADFEACMPVRRAGPVDGVAVRELPGCRCVSLTHQGPYDAMGPSYAKVFRYVRDKGYRPVLPTREVYHKGPGMIFRGNPKNYLTEIQVPVEAGPGGGGAS